jgi:hypothetical protein
MYGLFTYIFKTTEINPKINTEHHEKTKKALQVNMTEQDLHKMRKKRTSGKYD